MLIDASHSVNSSLWVEDDFGQKNKMWVQEFESSKTCSTILTKLDTFLTCSISCHCRQIQTCLTGHKKHKAKTQFHNLLFTWTLSNNFVPYLSRYRRHNTIAHNFIARALYFMRRWFVLIYLLLLTYLLNCPNLKFCRHSRYERHLAKLHPQNYYLPTSSSVFIYLSRSPCSRHSKKVFWTVFTRSKTFSRRNAYYNK